MRLIVSKTEEETSWTKLEAPELTEKLQQRMVEGTAEQAAGRSTAEPERRRDEFLVRLLEAGARVLARERKR